MANNQYVNKVVYGSQTIIDISDTTATADKILQGYGAYGADGAWMDGTASAGAGSAISIDDSTDSHGGTIRTITAVSLENDTVSPQTLLTGVTAHNSLGEPITGTYTPSGTNIEANKTVSPTESIQEITPSSGYDALAKVTVSAISSSYVGSGVTRRSSTDLTSSGATVTVPAGYYQSQASKAISNGSATAPASISGTSANVSTGSNTITLTKTVSVTPTVSAGYISSGTAGNSSVSLTASVTTKSAATITPTKSSQTIASGTYLTGTQTIAAIPAAYQDVTNVTAAAGDVVSGKTIVDSTGATVNGSLVINRYYTGSSAPSSSLGSNGDLYLKV